MLFVLVRFKVMEKKNEILARDEWTATKSFSII